MSQYAFWQKNTAYALGAFVLDGAGNIQKLTAPPSGGTSGNAVPSWTTTTTPDNGLTWTWQGFGGRARELQKPSGTATQPFVERFPDAVSFSSGTSADAGKFVLLNASGQLDSTMGGGGGSTVSVNSTPVSNPNFQDGDIKFHVSGSNITETVHALATTGAPVVIDTSAPPTHQGQLLISRPGNVSAAWADPFVQGPWVDGTPVVTPGAMGDGTSNIQPVYVGGKSTDGKLYGFLTDSGKNLLVNVANTPSVNVQASGTAITATGSSLNVNITGGGSSGVQYADGTTQATPTGTVALGKNPSNVLHALSLDGTGNLNIDAQAAVFAAATGAATPPSAAWIGASDGTNLQGLLTESVGNKNLRVAIFNAGNVATVTGANALKVDGSAVTQPVSGVGTFTVSESQFFAQGSTTSGQVGPLVQGAVTTNDPAYTTAQTSPLSLTTAGHLRTQDFATGPTGVAVPSDAIFVGGKGADGFLHGLSTDNTGALNVNATFSGTVNPGFVTDRLQSGTITATQNVAVNTNGAATVVIDVGTTAWTGTLVFEVLLADSVTWISATAYPVYVGGPGTTSTTANGQWSLPVAGFGQARVRGNTVTSGTATVNLEAAAGSFSVFVQQLSAADLNATVVQGSAGTIAQSWFTKVTDGTNVFGVTPAFPFSVQGTLTNNNAAPGANNVGVLPARANAAAPSWTEGDQVLLSVDTSGALRVSSSGTFTPALTADRTATGTITTTQNVVISAQGTGTVQFNITGTWTGTIVFEASVDGVNWLAAKVLPLYPTAFPEVSQTTVNGQWALATGGLNSFRVRGNTVASGTATIWVEGGAGVQNEQTLAMIFDPASGNTPAVKGSSVVPVSADNALVVSLSPNSSQFATSTTANALPGTNPVAVGTSSVAVVNSNVARKEITIVNTGTTIIYLGLGQTPTITAYHIALAKCTAANDGTGGTWTSDMFKGIVNAIGSATGGTVVWTELT